MINRSKLSPLAFFVTCAFGLLLDIGSARLQGGVRNRSTGSRVLVQESHVVPMENGGLELDSSLLMEEMFDDMTHFGGGGPAPDNNNDDTHKLELKDDIYIEMNDDKYTGRDDFDDWGPALGLLGDQELYDDIVQKEINEKMTAWHGI